MANNLTDELATIEALRAIVYCRSVHTCWSPEKSAAFQRDYCIATAKAALTQLEKRTAVDDAT